MPRATFRAAVYLVLLRDDHVLLLRRCNTGYEDGKYSLPAGHVEPGEAATQAMLREAAEEIGIELAEAQLNFGLVLHRRDTLDAEVYFDLFFTAQAAGAVPQNLEPDKCDELRWVPLDDLPDTVIPSVAYALTQLRLGSRLAEFGW